MRLTIYIDSKGRVIPANNISAPARAYPICVEKQNRKLRIFVSKKALTRPLSALINHIRMMKDCTIELVSELPNLKSDFFDKPISCFLRLGQAYLELFEKNHDGQFLSHIDFWEDIAEDADQLPFDITNLTKLKIGHLDTPTALAQLLQNETAKAAFYRFTAEQELALVKLPENMVHPPIAEDSLAPLREAVSDNTYYMWLQIAGQIAIATGQSLRQFGHLQLSGWPETGMHPFVKLLLPIASEFERPKNYRLITVTYLIHQKAYIL
jgi:hypothetical protein